MENNKEEMWKKLMEMKKELAKKKRKLQIVKRAAEAKEHVRKKVRDIQDAERQQVTHQLLPNLTIGENAHSDLANNQQSSKNTVTTLEFNEHLDSPYVAQCMFRNGSASSIINHLSGEISTKYIKQQNSGSVSCITNVCHINRFLSRKEERSECKSELQTKISNANVSLKQNEHLAHSQIKQLISSYEEVELHSSEKIWNKQTPNFQPKIISPKKKSNIDVTPQSLSTGTSSKFKKQDSKSRNSEICDVTRDYKRGHCTLTADSAAELSTSQNLSTNTTNQNWSKNAEYKRKKESASWFDTDSLPHCGPQNITNLIDRSVWLSASKTKSPRLQTDTGTQKLTNTISTSKKYEGLISSAHDSDRLGGPSGIIEKKETLVKNMETKVILEESSSERLGLRDESSVGSIENDEDIIKASQVNTGKVAQLQFLRRRSCQESINSASEYLCPTPSFRTSAGLTGSNSSVDHQPTVKQCALKDNSVTDSQFYDILGITQNSYTGENFVQDVQAMFPEKSLESGKDKSDLVVPVYSENRNIQLAESKIWEKPLDVVNVTSQSIFDSSQDTHSSSMQKNSQSISIRQHSDRLDMQDIRSNLDCAQIITIVPDTEMSTSEEPLSEYTELDAIPYSQFALIEDFLSEESLSVKQTDSGKVRKRFSGALVKRCSPRISSLSGLNTGNLLASKNTRSPLENKLLTLPGLRPARKKSLTQQRKSAAVLSVFQFLIDEAKNVGSLSEFELPSTFETLKSTRQDMNPCQRFCYYIPVFGEAEVYKNSENSLTDVSDSIINGCRGINIRALSPNNSLHPDMANPNWTDNCDSPLTDGRKFNTQIITENLSATNCLGHQLLKNQVDTNGCASEVGEPPDSMHLSEAEECVVMSGNDCQRDRDLVKLPKGPEIVSDHQASDTEVTEQASVLDTEIQPGRNNPLKSECEQTDSCGNNAYKNEALSGLGSLNKYEDYNSGQENEETQVPLIKDCVSQLKATPPVRIKDRISALSPATPLSSKWKPKHKSKLGRKLFNLTVSGRKLLTTGCDRGEVSWETEPGAEEAHRTFHETTPHCSAKMVNLLDQLTDVGICPGGKNLHHEGPTPPPTINLSDQITTVDCFKDHIQSCTVHCETSQTPAISRPPDLSVAPISSCHKAQQFDSSELSKTLQRKNLETAVPNVNNLPSPSTPVISSTFNINSSKPISNISLTSTPKTANASRSGLFVSELDFDSPIRKVIEIKESDVLLFGQRGRESACNRLNCDSSEINNDKPTVATEDYTHCAVQSSHPANFSSNLSHLMNSEDSYVSPGQIQVNTNDSSVGMCPLADYEKSHCSSIANISHVNDEVLASPSTPAVIKPWKKLPRTPTTPVQVLEDKNSIGHQGLYIFIPNRTRSKSKSSYAGIKNSARDKSWKFSGCFQSCSQDAVVSILSGDLITKDSEKKQFIVSVQAVSLTVWTTDEHGGWITELDWRVGPEIHVLHSCLMPRTDILAIVASGWHGKQQFVTLFIYDWNTEDTLRYNLSLANHHQELRCPSQIELCPYLSSELLLGVTTDTHHTVVKMCFSQCLKTVLSVSPCGLHLGKLVCLVNVKNQPSASISLSSDQRITIWNTKLEVAVKKLTMPLFLPCLTGLLGASSCKGYLVLDVMWRVDDGDCGGVILVNPLTGQAQQAIKFPVPNFTWRRVEHAKKNARLVTALNNRGSVGLWNYKNGALLCHTKSTISTSVSLMNSSKDLVIGEIHGCLHIYCAS